MLTSPAAAWSAGVRVLGAGLHVGRNDHADRLFPTRNPAMAGAQIVTVFSFFRTLCIEFAIGFLRLRHRQVVFVVGIVGLAVRCLSLGGLGAGLRIAAPAATTATTLTATLLVVPIAKILGGYGFFQRCPLVRLGDRRRFDRVDDVVDVLAFGRFFVIIERTRFERFRSGRLRSDRLATGRARIVSGAPSSAPSASTAATAWFVVRAGLFALSGCSIPFCPIVVLFGRNQIVDEVRRHHFVCNQLVGRFFESFVTFGRPLFAP
jgi:hypothetical protein